MLPHLMLACVLIALYAWHSERQPGQLTHKINLAVLVAIAIAIYLLYVINPSYQFDEHRPCYCDETGVCQPRTVVPGPIIRRNTFINMLSSFVILITSFYLFISVFFQRYDAAWERTLRARIEGLRRDEFKIRHGLTEQRLPDDRIPHDRDFRWPKQGQVPRGSPFIENPDDSPFIEDPDKAPECLVSSP